MKQHRRWDDPQHDSFVKSFAVILLCFVAAYAAMIVMLVK